MTEPVNGLEWPDMVADLFSRAPDGADRITVRGWMIERYFPDDGYDRDGLHVVDRQGVVVGTVQ